MRFLNAARSPEEPLPIAFWLFAGYEQGQVMRSLTDRESPIPTKSGERSVILGQLRAICRSFPDAVEIGEGSVGDPVYKVGGKIFAMLTEGRLVVKLPRQRVDELVGAGTGGPFEAGGGRVMREWVTVSPAHGEEWPALADEAHRFVGGAEVG